MDQPTQEELGILNDQRFLVVKQHLSDKVISHLAEIERLIHREIETTSFEFPEGTFLRAGKISKGENYRYLPYFLLDYPRLFTKKDVFAYRSMLWWGNEFSCTLHLAGQPLADHIKNLLSRLNKDKDIFFCLHENPWEYHFESSNYILASNLKIKDMEEHIRKHDFIKISAKISLDKWDQFSDFTLFNFKRFLNMLDQ